MSSQPLYKGVLLDMTYKFLIKIGSTYVFKASTTSKPYSPMAGKSKWELFEGGWVIDNDGKDADVGDVGVGVEVGNDGCRISTCM